MFTGGRSALFAALCCVLLPRPAAAQGTPLPTGQLSLTIGTTVIAFPTPSLLDIDLGYIDHTGTVVSIRSRPAGAAWELRIRADAATLGGYGKPVGDILWRTAASTTWTPLTGTDQAVVQGRGDADLTVFFRMRLDWAADEPGAYGAVIIFSVVRP